MIEYHDTDIPEALVAKALLQNKHLSKVRKFVLLFSWLGLPLAYLHSIRIGTVAAHNKTKHPKASGYWQYFGVPHSWLVSKNPYKRFVCMYNNFKDGWLGDKRGEWSHIREGKEGSIISMILWNGFRNPTNGLREMDYFSCVPDDLEEVHIWGHDFELDNKPKVDTGWWFIMGKKGDRTYHSFRAVNIVFDGKKAYNASIGFKLKPDHFTQGEDEAKGFTGRVSLFDIDGDGFKV